MRRKKKMTVRDAEIYIYEMWQKCKLPQDFTHEHPQYPAILSLVLEKGEVTTADLEALNIRKK